MLTETEKETKVSELQKKKSGSLSMITFAIMIVTTIVSLRGLPAQSMFGITSIFYFVFAAIVFLIPYSLICAELASTYPKEGGLFRWVAEAFGPKWGFVAIYLEWQMMVIWYPTVLIFCSVAISFILWPEASDTSLAGNIIYTIAISLLIYWAITYVILKKGVNSSTKLSAVGGLFGTIIPGVILILLAVFYVISGKQIHLPMDQPFFPDFSNFNNMVLAASIFLFYGGMEVNAVHVTRLKQPGKDFPRAIFIASIIVILMFVLATLAISIVVPRDEINLTQSLLIAYYDLWSALGLSWLGNLMALMITIGIIAQITTIVTGPSIGLHDVGKAGYLPKSLQKTNKQNVHQPILIVQGILVTILIFVLTLMPSVQSAYQILSQLATIIYMITVVLIYIAALRLRYTQPNKKRPFSIPGGNVGIWALSFIGIFGALFVCFISFIPPSQISTGNPIIYVGILLLGTVIFISLPFVMELFRKPSWVDANRDFEAFDWEIEGRSPHEKSKL